jgi:aminopeptidase N
MGIAVPFAYLVQFVQQVSTMNRVWIYLSVISAAALFVPHSQAEEELQCWRSLAPFAPPATTSSRQYAADKEVQALHLALDVTPSFKQRTISATAALTFKVTSRPVQQLKLDAVDLDVTSVIASEKLIGYDVTPDQLVITFAQPLRPGKEASVTVAYSAEPREGLYFRTPEQGYRAGDTHLFSQGEEIEARHWYPCLDQPNQRLTSEITCRVPEGMTVISNGKLLSKERDPVTGLLAFHWSQEKPHANYLVSLAAGYFEKVEDKCGSTPLAFYTPRSEIKQAATSFRDTKAIMEFFEHEIGVPFPWAKYDQVCVNDFVAGGMENTSATTLNDRTLFTEATENVRESEGLIAHEMAHQWFGDLVTCKDWSQVWLNEGFATFYETLYNEHRNGHDSYLYSLYQRNRQITAMTNDFEPIVRRSFDSPSEMFNYLVYPKAGWALHMLRAQLGDNLFRDCVKTYLQRHQFGNVTTEDFRSVIEELSGRSFDRFFDQWFYHGHFPELQVAYNWDELTKLARFTVRQTQETGPRVLLYQFPLKLRLKGKFGTREREVQVTQKEEDFYLPADSTPEIARVDPDYTLLAKASFNLPKPMLYAQLGDSKDVIGRLQAIEQLSREENQESIRRLKQVLGEDPFYGVRIEAAKALRTIHTPEALNALTASTKQKDARVRRAVVEDIGAFFNTPALDSARRVIAAEKNPAVAAPALTALGLYSTGEVRNTLIEFLNSDSYRNELADAAIGAIRLQANPDYAGFLMETLARKEADFTSRGFGLGLETLAIITRNEEKKDAVCDFLLQRVNHPKETIQIAAIQALGALGNPRALGVLDGLTSGDKESRVQKAALAALSELRSGRKQADEIRGLRQEVLDLQKHDRELRKDLDALKKKLELKKEKGK